MRTCFLVVLLFSVCNLFAQDGGAPDAGNTPLRSGQKSDLKNKIVYGGNLGLSFGNITSIGATPIIGYKVTDRFIPGVGFSYYYTKYHFAGYPPIATHYYGGSIWARYYILDRIFLHGEAEAINGEWDPYLHPGYRDYRNSYLVGGGYRESYGNVSSYILVLYVLNVQESAYASPLVIRAGFAFGM